MVLYSHAFRCAVALDFVRVAVLRSRPVVVDVLVVLVRALVVAIHGLTLNGRRSWDGLEWLHCSYLSFAAVPGSVPIVLPALLLIDSQRLLQIVVHVRGQRAGNMQELERTVFA